MDDSLQNAPPSHNAAPSMPRRNRFLRRLQRRWSVFALALGGFAAASTLRAPRPNDILAPPIVKAAPAPMPLAYPFLPSPNCDDRPPGTVLSCIVLHATETHTPQAALYNFLNPKAEVSAHFLVSKTGRVVQLVPVERRAWHAGISELEGVPRVNDYSVGIEMANNNDGLDPYTEEQYQAVAGIIRFLRSRYAIPDSRIVSHAQIALPPGRKTDPNGFDFEKIKALAR